MIEVCHPLSDQEARDLLLRTRQVLDYQLRKLPDATRRSVEIVLKIEPPKLPHHKAKRPMVQRLLPWWVWSKRGGCTQDPSGETTIRLQLAPRPVMEVTLIHEVVHAYGLWRHNTAFWAAVTSASHTILHTSLDVPDGPARNTDVVLIFDRYADLAAQALVPHGWAMVILTAAWALTTDALASGAVTPWWAPILAAAVTWAIAVQTATVRSLLHTCAARSGAPDVHLDDGVHHCRACGWTLT